MSDLTNDQLDAARTAEFSSGIAAVERNIRSEIKAESTVPDKCCGNCKHGKAVEPRIKQLLRCRAPLPNWAVKTAVVTTGLVADSDGTDCKVFKQRGAK